MDDADEDRILSCRTRLARLFNADDPNRIIFTSGSTESLNLAFKGLELRDAHVIGTATEHNSVIRPLNHLNDEIGVTSEFVQCDRFGNVDPDEILKAIKPNTKMIVVNHVSNITGAVQDMQAIGKIAKDHGLLFMADVSQSAGSVPVDVKAWNADFVAFTAHKSLYGVQGTGGFYIREGLDIKPLKTGGTGSKSHVLYQPQEMPGYYEAGTPNVPGILALNAGLDWIERTGFSSIHLHKKKLYKKILEALSGYHGVNLYTDPEKSSAGVISFNIGDMAPEEVSYMLESSFAIKVRSGLHCAPLIHKYLGTHPWGTVRMSHSYFTKEEDIDLFITAVKKIADSFV